MADDWVWKQFVGTDAYANSYANPMTGETMDQWQSLRFIVWPFIVGSAMTQAFYIALWLIMDGYFSRSHRIACIVAGVTAGILAFIITRYWDNSSSYWIAFTLGLFVLAGISVITTALMLLHAKRRKGR